MDKELWMRQCHESRGTTILPLEVLATGRDPCRCLPFVLVAVKGVRYKKMLNREGSLGLGVVGSDESAGKATLLSCVTWPENRRR